MKKLILAVGADDNYISNLYLQNYLNSINVNSNFDENILVYIGNQNVQSNLPKLQIFNLNPNSVVKKNINNCIQHGEFLNSDSFDKFSDEDIIVFTDGDMVLQRELNSEEINLLKNLGDNDVYVGYNQSPGDTLENEYFRLVPKYQTIPDIFKVEGVKIYNTGVLCMNKKTWVKLRDSYVKKFDLINDMFVHHAKQQWLICYILGNEGYNIIEMSYEVHNHTHYPPPNGTTMDNGVVKYDNKVVLFKHRWF